MARIGVAMAVVTPDATVDVVVRGVAAGGAGVADLPDGRVVFVPRTAPGDRVRIRVHKEKARWALGTLEEVLEPGPERVEAPCPLYDRCGGCQLQHLAYPEQLVWKGRFVRDALTRLGGLEESEPPAVVASPVSTGYRNRITFTLRRLRGGRVVAGFHALGRPTHVVDVHGQCILPEPEVMRAWKALRAGWGTGARLLPQGGRLRLTLRTERAPAEGVRAAVHLVVDGGERGWRSTELLEAVPALAGARHRPAQAHRAGAREVEGRGAAARGPGAREDGPEPNAEGGTAFVQVNRAVAESLTAHVLSIAGTGEGTAVDAYAGIGAFGRPLAQAGWRVTAIELDAEAADIAGRDAPADYRVVEGRVEEQLAAHLPTDLLVLNPPRTGLDPDVSTAVIASPPERIVYVSCDPATLARDLKALSECFEVSDVRAFDLFPQTAHVETVVTLVRRAAP